ncbi:hydrogenase 3 large subunit [Moorella thermoacetica]|uniref:NADH dehydrogenase (Ubiquinone), 30 kDa subunit n=1 Tax=Moorella thermoacetica (strain ATCC 39073 / JCM 9320) TaxID=264732 RepID=Q2RGG4_MOOTA|nr:hydrogenase large subunit [Moorella thermoacetica]AKX97654.1 formate hydrogenlyase subunit 5 precursor [Moorella thermoacetica]OIQ53935.1 formate hydrogenlyase subunit 5 precursor [Moorella thermoacetica]QDA01476.1 Formate hydrogenlyase subunit 5 precursor [Moorella thermoacetica]TYL06604.1 Formate hydrogenlyase subunit 5 [Moorella thermoacetica]TYL06882.1 Formate hydrogenlyase subunit 5 [Moorella thermoacetica]
MGQGSESKRAQKYIKDLRSKFPGAILEESSQAPDQITVTVKLNDLPGIVEELYYRHNGWLSTMLGNDERELNGCFALYYVLSMEGNSNKRENTWITVKALVPEKEPQFPSVTPRVPAAVWYEREVRDMFGLEPVGIPDARRLVLPDDWPDNLHPLRKDAMDYRYRPEPVEENYNFIEVEGEGIVEVPLGPLHITSDEPGHFRLFVDGEYIVDADYRLFYVHRGMEKLAENRMDYDQITFLAERICGICGYAHSVAYAAAVETANGIEVPPRAQYIRTILLEVERLHSHLLNLGLAAHLVGFDSGFMHFFRVREKAMQMAEILTGGRKTYGINLIGGVRRDIFKEERDQVLRLIAEIRTELDELLDILINTPNFISRTQGVGRLERQVARDFSPVGPNMRGSGYARDTRADHPYGAYDRVSWEVISKDGCDVLSRELVRAAELYESFNIIERCLTEMPPGPVLTEGFAYKPHTFALGYTEAPRGENVHWLMTGNNQKLYRWRVRAATYNNWPALRYMFRGNTVSDAPLIVASIDPCYSCTERVTMVDVRKKKARTIEYKELERYCRERKYSPLKF